MHDFGGLTFSDRKLRHPIRRHYFFSPQLRALTLVLAVLGLQACKSDNERALELAQQAESLLQAGDLVNAQIAIGKAIVLREDGQNFNQLAGTIALQRGDPLGAYRSFQAALDFDGSNRMALAYVANLGVQIGRVSDAEEAADRLLTLEPNAIPALQAKGLIALARGKDEEAKAFADRLLAINPQDEAGTIVKARVLAKEGKSEEAIALIDNAVGARDSSAMLSNKVNLYRYMGQAEPMLAALGQLASKANANSSVKLDNINLLYKTGRIGPAREAGLALLKSGTRNPDDYRTLQRLWWQYDRTPFPAGAARDSSGWADPLAIVQAVRYTLARGDVAAANALLTSAPASANDLLESLKLRVKAQSGQAVQVVPQVDALLARDDQDVDALLLKARFSMEKKDRQSALEAVQRAQANDPLNPETYIVLAGVYRAEGNNLRARQIFEEGFQKLPQNFHLVEAYTQYLHQLGDKTRALSLARSFARAAPSSELAWTLFLAQCQQARDEACVRTAQSGLNDAKTAYLIDDQPGTPPDRGLFGRL